MRRDMDFIRELLLKIEGGQTAFETLDDETAPHLGEAPTGLSREDAQRLEGHLNLLEQANFIEISMRGGGGGIIVDRILWAGHDFLDAVREPKVWTETKTRAEKVGGWTVGILTDIAKGYIKAKAAEHGIPLG